MSWEDSTTDRDTPGRPRRGKRHFDPRTQGGPCESRMDGGDYLAREWGDDRWIRWRRVPGMDLWEREE